MFAEQAMPFLFQQIWLGDVWVCLDKHSSHAEQNGKLFLALD